MSKDFFISYNHKDKNEALWIEKVLTDNGYKTVMQDLDFHAGANISLEMDKAAKDSDYIIIVLTTNYLSSNYTAPEWAAFFMKDPKGEKRSIIPILISEDVEVRGLLNTIRYIDVPKVINSSGEEELELNVKNLILEEINAIKESRRLRRDVSFPFKKK